MQDQNAKQAVLAKLIEAMQELETNKLRPQPEIAEADPIADAPAVDADPMAEADPIMGAPAAEAFEGEQAPEAAMPQAPGADDEQEMLAKLKAMYEQIA